MAESNEFIREVDEDYRRDQIARLWTRHSGLIIALAVLLVASVAGWRYYQGQQAAAAEAASERFDSANKLAQAGNLADADRAFTALKADGPPGYRLLARFRLAAETTKTDRAAAADQYEAIAADTGVGDGLRDLARLRTALLRLDAPDPAPALASLQGLAAPNGAFRHTAREMLGLAALKRGEIDAAAKWFDGLAADPDLPQGLRRRIEVYEALVAGGPVTITEAKPEAAAPPPPITR